jgi:regulator of sigma E protease
MVSGFVSLIIFLFALGGMIFVHELGHFIAARWAGIEVEEFGLGLPSKKLVTLFTWQGTEFTIHALLLGGFIRPKGENDPNIPGGLAAANPWKRLVVLFAGPMMNLITAIVVFSFLISLQGVSVPGSVKIDAVTKNSPAQDAGLQTGDILLAINGKNITDVEPAIAIIRKNLDKPVELLINRSGEKITLTATPLSTRTKSEGALGIALTYPTRPATFVESIKGGFMVTGIQAATIVYLPIALIRGAIAPADARFIGFKGIFDLFNVAVKEDVSTRQQAAAAPASAGTPTPPQPTNWTLNLIGLLSISLGVMNLFPIPALDGGRILFTLPEILFRRRIPAEWENRVNAIAMLLLIGLMLFVNVMDFVNPAHIPLPYTLAETLTFQNILDHLLDSKKDIPHGHLSYYSDLDPKSLRLFLDVWPSVKPDRKLLLLNELLANLETDNIVSYEGIGSSLLDDADGEVRARAIRLLAESDEPKLAIKLTDILLNDADLAPRMEAAHSLGEFILLGELEKIPGNIQPKAEDALIKVIRSDDNPSLRKHALEALGYSSRTEIVQLIESAFQRADPTWMASALRAMGRSHDERWNDDVINTLLHDDPRIRFSAVEAAGELGIEDAGPILLQMLEEEEEEDDVVAAAIWSLSQIGGDDARIYLLSLIEKTEDEDIIEFLEDALENLDFMEELNKFDLLSLDEDDRDELDETDEDE